MSVQRRCSKNSLPRTKEEEAKVSFETLASDGAPSKSHLTGLVCLTGHTLLPTSLADLIGTDPLALDGPSAEALVVGVVASKVAVLYQTTTRVPAREVNDFILAVCQRMSERETCLYRRKTPYLAHDCGFAANRRFCCWRSSAARSW